MRIILWRLAESHGFFSRGAEESARTLNEPLAIAEEMLAAVLRAPGAAIESQGPGLETKVFEIASTVADTIAMGATRDVLPEQLQISSPQTIFSSLQKLLARNSRLYGMLQAKIGGLQVLSTSDPVASIHAPVSTDTLDIEIEQQLQAHGFDFTDPFRAGQSPDEESQPSSSGFSPGLDHSSTLGIARNETYAHTIPGIGYDLNALNFQAPTAFSTYSDGSWDGSNFPR